VNDQELRALVRDAVTRHLSRPAPASSGPMPAFVPQAPATHASHAMYLIVNTTDSCIIEPSVTCNHCGYCKSHGH